jgi:hypothetical protein
MSHNQSRWPVTRSTEPFGNVARSGRLALFETTMQFDFYTVDEGERGAIELRELGHVEAPSESAKATVNRHFHKLLADNPAVGNVFVVSSLGDRIVATEYVDAQNGKGRRLQWVVDPSTRLA